MRHAPSRLLTDRYPHYIPVLGDRLDVDGNNFG
jgi:hypothetical protein